MYKKKTKTKKEKKKQANKPKNSKIFFADESKWILKKFLLFKEHQIKKATEAIQEHS